MILHALKLSNYRKFRRLEIEFPTGLVGVVGRNGTGKTTLLEAVAFALYGAPASRTGARELINDGAPAGEGCAVELDFSLDGTPYRVSRKIRGEGKAVQAALYRIGSSEPLATQARGVEQAVRRLLGMDYLSFTRSIFSRQKEVNALSDETPAARQRVIRRMVGIETVSRAREAIAADRRQQSVSVESSKLAIRDLPARRAELASLQPLRKTAREEASRAAATAVAAGKAAKSARAAFERLEAGRARHAVLEKRKSGFEAALGAASGKRAQIEEEIRRIRRDSVELESLSGAEADYARVLKLKETLDVASGKAREKVALERSLSALSAEHAAAKSAESDAVAAAASARKAAAAGKKAGEREGKARSELAKLRKSRQEAEGPLGKARGKLDEAEDAMAKVREFGPDTECPTCFRKFGDSHAEVMAHLEDARTKAMETLADLQARIEKIEQAIAVSEASVDKAVKGVHEAAVAARESARAAERLMSARRERARIERDLKAGAKRLDALSRVMYDPKEHAAARSEHRRLSAVHDRAEALRHGVSNLPRLMRSLGIEDRRAAKLRLEIAAVEKAMVDIGFDAHAHQEAMKADKAAQAELLGAATAREKAGGELKRIQASIDRISAEVRELDILRRSIEGAEDEVRHLEKLEILFGSFRDELAGRIRPIIEDGASFLLNQVTDGTYPRISLGENYEIELHDASGPHQIRRFSGGEEDLANLCLRIAISQAVAHRARGAASSLLVLDEVFGSQDAQRREKILQALLRLQEVFQQIILITHTEDINDRVANVLRVTEDSAHRAAAVWM